MNDDYVKRTLNAYNAHPEKYEAATASMTPEEEIKKFMQLVPDRNMPVLDAGCAFGRDTALFAQHGFEVIGIDMSDALLDRARELYPELMFRNMDVRQLDLGDNSIAGIWCHATLLHLKDEDTLRALKEFQRVLSPGGVLFLSFKEGEGDEEFVEKFSSEAARYFNYQKKDHVARMVDQAGLTVKEIYIINELQKWGPGNRDLNWVYCFAQK